MAMTKRNEKNHPPNGINLNLIVPNIPPVEDQKGVRIEIDIKVSAEEKAENESADNE